MFKENIENFLAGPGNEYSAVEAHKPTKNRFADQETQVGMAEWRMDNKISIYLSI